MAVLSSVDYVESDVGRSESDDSPDYRVISQLADLNLDIDLSGLQKNQSPQWSSSLSNLVGNLTSVVRQTKDCASGILTALPKISALANQSDQSSILMQEIDAELKGLTAAIETNSRLTRQLADVVQAVGRNTDSGNSAVADVVTAMDNISQHSSQIGEFTDIIDQLAFQTNLLALNAAVEAARAGDQGRGFAVVATEVRTLAQRSADAAKEISDYVGRSVDSVAEGRQSVSNAQSSMVKIGESVSTLEELIQSVSDTTLSQETCLDDVHNTVEKLGVFGQKNERMSKEVLGISDELNYDAGYLMETVKMFSITGDEFTHPFHRAMAQEACSAARTIGRLFEWGIENGQVSADDLFNPTYTAINGTDPQKHNTGFDAFCDRHLPEIQEPIFELDAGIAFAMAADCNGYVPTHVRAHCQPLTGDYSTDLVGNRTKRIFSDHVGRTVGRHQRDYMLQVHRRDTGEIMFDMSAPIYVNGTHFGGFRIGYKLPG